MMSRKICMLGGYAVGKTSLVRRYVHGVFSERYLTTIGVKIDKKVVALDGKEMTLVLWDMAGENGIEKVRLSYLRGASGYLLVVDGTRDNSLRTAVEVQRKAHETLGDVPFLLLTNKIDLIEQWTIPDAEIQILRERGWHVLATSAKDGTGVNEAFARIAEDILTHECPIE